MTNRRNNRLTRLHAASARQTKLEENDEARMTNDEKRTKARMTKGERNNNGARCFSGFVIPSTFVIRASSFGNTIFLLVGAPRNVSAVIDRVSV